MKLGIVGSFFLVAACQSTNSPSPTMDSGSACTQDQQLCGGACVNPKVDPQNCGACGTACKKGEVCSLGTCQTSCGTGTMQCGSSCVDTQIDHAHCGGCNTTCMPNEACSTGKCSSVCASNQTFCGSDGGMPFCANEKTDNANCGACGNVCPQGKVCSLGQCSTSCDPSLTTCSGDGGAPYCADTKNDNTNCGACGNTCGALETCVAGQCQSGCVMGQTLCSPDGGPPYCANLQTDNANCGSCGTVCSNAQTCVQGQCKAICNPTALVLGDTDSNSNTAYQTILQNIGFTVNLQSDGTSSYAGNPSASGFGAVIITPGQTYDNDMPNAGQTSVANAQKAGTGVVFTEWTAYTQTIQHYQSLSSLVLFAEDNYVDSSTLTFTLTANNHPVWTNLPSKFTTSVALGANIGNTLTNNGQQIASCAECQGIGVAVRSSPGGRIVHVAHAAAYNGAAWYNDANLVKLTQNAAQWAANCK